MSDRVFSGRDVQEALAAAAQALGVSATRLRYVVLEAGTGGGLGLKPTPARVAVLLAGSAPAQGAPADPREARNSPLSRPSPPLTPPSLDDPAACLGRLVDTLARAAALDLRAEVSVSADTFEVWLRGDDARSFLLGDGRPEVLEALDHLLHGIYARRVAPLRLRIECEGRREHREARLKEEARALAGEVLRDGQPRTTDALNSYERRLVHMAASEIPGVITYSVGGGVDRRVTIAPEKASLGGEVH